MFKKHLFLIFNLFVFSFLTANTSDFKEKKQKKTPLVLEENDTVKKMFSDAMIEYSNHEYMKAIDLWKKVLVEAKRRNIGIIISYNRYHFLTFFPSGIIFRRS